MGRPFAQDFEVTYYPLVTTTTGAQNTTVFDMNGFEGVILIGGRGTTEANTSGGLSFSVGSASASGGLSQTTGIQVLNKTSIYLDLYRPDARFVQGNFLTSVTTTGANGPGMVAIRYGPRALPTTQPASTTGKILYSPVTGTATG